MTDFPITSRLREIASDLRASARAAGQSTSVSPENLSSVMEDQAAKLNEIILDLDQPSAGTSAYEMVAAAEAQNVEVTETLIHMIAATVLHKLVQDEGGGRVNITFGPQDMDEMHRLYEMNAKRDGLLTTITLSPRKHVVTKANTVLVAADEAGGVLPLPPADAHLEDRPESLMLQDEPETPFEPQAEAHEHDRPLWAARISGRLVPASSRDVAEQKVEIAVRGDEIATVENRWCYHQDCPAERCNHAEATSDA